MAKKKAAAKKPTAKQILDDINSENPKFEESLEWLLAKQKLDRMIGMAIESDQFKKSGMCTEPFGASNFLGTKVGFQEVGGERTDKLGLIILVKRKERDRPSVGTSVIPQEVLGKPTDIQVEDEPSFLALNAGEKITGNQSKTGTFGCVVKLRGQDPSFFFMLSNQHVLARPVAQRGDVISKGGQEIATLSEWVDFDPPVFIDAAVALITANGLSSHHSPHYTMDPEEILTAELNDLQNATRGGLLVKKVGGTSRVTFGRIMSTNRSVDVGGHTFREQITVDGQGKRFSKSGDSGSLVVTHPGNRPVGLLFAGSGNTSYVNRIENVMQPFGISEFVA